MLPAFVAIIAAAHLNDCTGPAVANPVTVLKKIIKHRRLAAFSAFFARYPEASAL